MTTFQASCVGRFRFFVTSGAIALLALSVSPAGSAEAPDPGLEAIRGALQAKAYDQAVTAAEKYLADQPKDGETALYLKGIAQNHAKQYDAAVTTADIIITKHKESSWGSAAPAASCTVFAYWSCCGNSKSKPTSSCPSRAP